MSIVMLLTDAHEPAAEILPSLSLLSHAIRVAPASVAVAADGPGADAVLVDARRDLVQVRRLLRLLRSAEMNVPVLAVVTEGGWAAVTADWGVDDVILHTAGPGEVDARLRLAIGRMAPAASGEIRSGDLVIDEVTYSARLRGRSLDLTFKEFELLKFLAQHPGRVFTRSQLLHSTIAVGKMIRHGDPGDPDPAESPQPSPAHGNYSPKFPIPPGPNSADPKLVARKGAIGPAPDAANNEYLGLEYYKQLVPNAEVTLPGSICEACTPREVAPNNTWLPIALADLLEGIGGGIVAPHSQSAPSSLHLVRVLKERGKLDLLKGIITPEGGTDLAAAGLVGSDFDTIPFLMMNGDYRPMAFREGNYAAVAAMNASPTRKVGPALVVSAEDPRFEGKFNGHTHMGMLGSTALAQFDVFLDWAEKNIPNPIVNTSCTKRSARGP